MLRKGTLFGVDSFINQSSLYNTERIALVTNDAALTSTDKFSRVALLNAGFNIIKIFSPEHGINSKGADGAYQSDSIDPETQLPVISLYSDKLIPSEEDLKNVDLILFDIPDVGVRFYTYLWTLTLLMEACSIYNKPLIILDRPNPLSGDLSLAEGPMLDEKNCSSFIGRWNIPVRHSCTYGELAKYFASIKNIKVDIKVIRLENWDRNKNALNNGWKFTLTSPAITNIETALLYPGMGLLEGINVNEGRGTKTPFKKLGAPWINPNQLSKEFEELMLPGVKAEQIEYTPIDSVYKNEKCYGIKLKIINSDVFRPVFTGLQIITLIQRLFEDKCEERLYKTVANPTGQNHLDRLTGIFNSFEKIKTGELIEKYYTTNNWKEKITPNLLY